MRDLTAPNALGTTMPQRLGARQISAAEVLALSASHWYDARSNASGAAWVPRISGAAYTAAQSFAPGRPTTTTIGSGSHPALSFDGTNHLMDIATPWALGNNTPFSVVTFVQRAGTGTRWLFAQYAAANVTGTGVGLGQTGAGPGSYVYRGSDNIPGNTLAATPISIGVTYTSGRSSQAYVSGAAVGAPVSHPVAAATAPDFCRIASGASLGGALWQGLIAHILVYEGRTLTAGEMATLNTFLAGLCA